MDLLGYVHPGMSVCEVGCGAAHICSHVTDRGGVYTGLDVNPAILEKNRRLYPGSRFISAAVEVRETFDMVLSLYTIEHCPDPIRHMEVLMRLCRSGGLVGIVAPEYVNGSSLSGSIFYGITPRRLRQKLASFSFIDAFCHVTDLFIAAPAWKRRAQHAIPGKFWINLLPRALRDSHFLIDSDAVHLPCRADIEWWLEKKGAVIEKSSARFGASIPRDIARNNLYVLARKLR
jgi:SAM-dependent methyltransferase